MPETFAALLFAHVLADFIFQTNWMVAHKRRLPVMLAHVGIVGVQEADDRRRQRAQHHHALQ